MDVIDLTVEALALEPQFADLFDKNEPETHADGSTSSATAAEIVHAYRMSRRPNASGGLNPGARLTAQDLLSVDIDVKPWPGLAPCRDHVLDLRDG